MLGLIEEEHGADVGRPDHISVRAKTASRAGENAPPGFISRPAGRAGSYGKTHVRFVVEVDASDGPADPTLNRPGKTIHRKTGH